MSQVRRDEAQVSYVIYRCMVTLQKRNNAGQQMWWVTLKDGGSRIGVIYKSKGRHTDYMWRELGFDTKPHPCKTPSEGVERLILRLNGGRGV